VLPVRRTVGAPASGVGASLGTDGDVDVEVRVDVDEGSTTRGSHHGPSRAAR